MCTTGKNMLVLNLTDCLRTNEPGLALYADTPLAFPIYLKKFPRSVPFFSLAVSIIHFRSCIFSEAGLGWGVVGGGLEK